MQKIIAWIMVILGAMHALFPVAPKGEKLSLDGYTLVFEDEFDADTLDTSVWYHRALGERRAGYNAESQVRLEDGKLILRAEYLEDGAYGAGWYAGMVALRQKYQNGYFEICCRCCRDKDFWSAFWLQCGTSYDHAVSAGGVGGAEIDIFEAMEAKYFPGRLASAVKSTVYCNGTDVLEDRIDRCRVGKYYVDDLYGSFHTFGLKWTQSEYIFYIDGVESGRTSFGKGVSQIPEEVIVSLEIPEKIKQQPGASAEFAVDWVKIWEEQ
ncbi:MAG: glycoside hydrolase family 16 protein [Clostridia bacterium]|nr:glycoside hydrolase family 16 protein [Clostridia bacterium]